MKPQHHVRLGDFRVWLHPTPTGFKWADAGEQCDDCGHDTYTRKGQVLACDKCGSEYTIHGPTIPVDNSNPTKEDTMAKKNSKPADDLGLDAPAPRKRTAPTKPAAKGKPAAKASKVQRLAGKKLAPTEKGLAAREGSLRGSIVQAFKGGRTYETGLANLSTSVRKSPRGKTGAELKSHIVARVSSLVRKGLLKVV